MPRLLRWVNLAIAVVVLAALGLVYWFAWRPLPQTSGRVAAPVAREVTVARDARGVPHITAATLNDALFAQGYCTAQDRLWQMDALRRLAAGELAEIVGAAALESDRESRRLRLRRLAEQAYTAMDAESRAEVAAYTRGVNYFLVTHMNRLPVEFTLLRYDPLPWSAVDTLLVGLQMFRTLTTSWRADLARSGMLEAGRPAKMAFLFSTPRAGGELLPGSNAWALAGSRTASGKPLLANDPHLEFSMPGAWYLMHLKAPGLNVAGATLPGIPGVVIGHNERIAWGITNLQFDVQDLYIERFDPRTARYVFRGQSEQARVEREIIRVKGERNEELLNVVTRHGPLVVQDAERALALRWVGAEPGSAGLPFVAMDRARNWTEFTAALARFSGPASNLVYADVDGNIGYHATGRLPIRRKSDGSLPVDGASGEFEWDGFIPFDELPSAFNPPGGMVVTANQNPFPAGYGYAVGGNFASHHRARQIGDLLQARKGWRAADMPAVQKDVFSSFSRLLARHTVAAWDNLRATNPQLQEAVAMLRSWNGQMEKDLAAPFVSTLLFQHFRKAVAESAAPGKGGVYDRQVSVAALERLLRERPGGWFPDYDRALLTALQGAVEEGRRMQGRKLSGWRYGRYLRLAVAHPVLHRIPWVGKYFDLGPVEMSGSSTTVKQTSRRLGPSMRMNVDLGDWDRSLINVVAGQSGQPLSGHYKDQWKKYYTGASDPMEFGKVEAKAVLRLTPTQAR